MVVSSVLQKHGDVMTETSVISNKASIGSNVSIGNFCTIYDNVVLEDGVSIGDFCIIGSPTNLPSDKKTLVICSGSVIRSHSCLYEGANLGKSVQTGHHVTIREQSVLGKGVSVGSYSAIEGDCQIGDYSRLHGYVHVGKGSSIGRFVWLYSLVTLTNDALPPLYVEDPVTIEDGVVVCVGCTIFPGSVLRKGCYATAGTQVRGEVGVGRVVAGSDCADVGHVSGVMHLGTMTRLPWMKQLKERYPPDVHDALDELHSDVQESKKNRQLRGD